MPLRGSVLLVRHGHDRSDGSGNLSPAGIEHATRARNELLARGLGENALILTSLATRARQTAEIIGAPKTGLGATVVEASTTFTRFSNDPVDPRSLDQILADELAAVDKDPANPDNQLVVVTHTPLIVGAMGFDPSGGSNGRVPYGSITPYELGSWDPGKWQNS